MASPDWRSCPVVGIGQADMSITGPIILADRYANESGRYKDPNRVAKDIEFYQRMP
jgi:hypothetical protein